MSFENASLKWGKGVFGGCQCSLLRFLRVCVDVQCLGSLEASRFSEAVCSVMAVTVS